MQDAPARILAVSGLAASQVGEDGITTASEIGGIPAGTYIEPGTSSISILEEILSAPAKDIKVFAFANTAIPTGTTSSPFVLSDDWAVDTTTKAIVSAVGFAQHINAGVIESGTAKAQYVCFAVPNDTTSTDPWGSFEISKWQASGFSYNIPHTGPIPAYNSTTARNYNLYYLDVPSYDSDLTPPGIDYTIYITSTT